tara:strand:+ start:696 stop:1301 length:606 start_codon:yes stop_codon:yes gene_type:complete
MIERKKKLRIIQVSLLLLGVLILFFTYKDNNSIKEKKIIEKKTLEVVKEQLAKQSQNQDVFYNIEYSGLDLAGNRYILKSEEAYAEKNNQEVINMKFVKAIFYFKDNTVLNVSSDNGIYNNKTLDMDFKGNVNAEYEGSKLFSHSAKFSNSESYLIIEDDVEIEDVRGTVIADKLYFDIKKQTLNITSFNESKINANINLK